MSDRKGVSNKERFPRRKNASGRTLCRVCGELTMDNRHTFCGPRCLRDFFMRTDWERVRKVVYIRDGGICMKCGRKVHSKRFHVDHIVPLSAGGDEWELSNLEISCPECNLQKGTNVEIEYVVLKPSSQNVSAK
jgi:5-methylcytosine-specific restriction endonuclease McrA